MDSVPHLALPSSANSCLSCFLSAAGRLPLQSPRDRHGLPPLTQLFKIFLDVFPRSHPSRPALMSHRPEVGPFAHPSISSWQDEWVSIVGTDQS